MSEDSNVIDFKSDPEDYVVRFLSNGEVQINEKYTTTDAAKEMWTALKGFAFEAWSYHSAAELKKSFESGANAAANSPAPEVSAAATRTATTEGKSNV